MKANDYQVDGDHYRKDEGEQHWDRQWRLHGRGYFIGCITKYVERYPYKNGIRDLKKAAHFLQKLIELEAASTPMPPPVKSEPDFRFFWSPEVARYVCRKCGELVLADSAKLAADIHGQCKATAKEE